MVIDVHFIYKYNLFILEWVYKIKGYTMRKKYIGLLILIFSLFNATLLTISATSEDISNEVYTNQIEGTSSLDKDGNVVYHSNEELEENILSVYAKLYRKYEADKKYVPKGNLIEVKFEDFEADALGITEKIYRTLSIPGFEEARTDIAAYLEKKKGYKKNAYKYEARTLELVNKHWDFALQDWGYTHK